VKALSEQNEARLDLYVSHRLPMAVVASMMGKSSVELADKLRHAGLSVRACAGTAGEREAAFGLIAAARANGVVLDSYAAWLVSSFNLIPVFKSLFARVAITQSAIDEFIELRQDYETHGNRPILTIGYQDGQYFKEEVAPEVVARSICTIQGVIDDLRGNLEILPAVRPANVSDLEDSFSRIGGSQVLDAIYAAKNAGFLLVSEDMSVRTVAREMQSLDSAWLQAIVMTAVDAGVLGEADYAEVVAQLALRRHAHLALRADTLRAILVSDSSEGMAVFKAAADMIGGENASIESHFSVGWDFVRGVWNLDQPYLKKARAAGTMLERLAGLLARHGLLESTFKKLLEPSDLHPLLADYLRRWCVGHFIFAGRA